MTAETATQLEPSLDSDSSSATLLTPEPETSIAEFLTLITVFGHQIISECALQNSDPIIGYECMLNKDHGNLYISPTTLFWIPTPTQSHTISRSNSIKSHTSRRKSIPYTHHRTSYAPETDHSDSESAHSTFHRQPQPSPTQPFTIPLEIITNIQRSRINKLHLHCTALVIETRNSLPSIHHHTTHTFHAFPARLSSVESQITRAIESVREKTAERVALRRGRIGPKRKSVGAMALFNVLVSGTVADEWVHVVDSVSGDVETEDAKIKERRSGGVAEQEVSVDAKNAATENVSGADCVTANESLFAKMWVGKKQSDSTGLSHVFSGTLVPSLNRAATLLPTRAVNPSTELSSRSLSVSTLPPKRPTVSKKTSISIPIKSISSATPASLYPSVLVSAGIEPKASTRYNAVQAIPASPNSSTVLLHQNVSIQTPSSPFMFDAAGPQVSSSTLAAPISPHPLRHKRSLILDNRMQNDNVWRMQARNAAESTIRRLDTFKPLVETVAVNGVMYRIDYTRVMDVLVVAVFGAVVAIVFVDIWVIMSVVF